MSTREIEINPQKERLAIAKVTGFIIAIVLMVLTFGFVHSKYAKGDDLKETVAIPAKYQMQLLKADSVVKEAQSNFNGEAMHVAGLLQIEHPEKYRLNINKDTREYEFILFKETLIPPLQTQPATPAQGEPKANTQPTKEPEKK